MPRAGVTAAPLPVLSKGRGGRGENAGAAVTSSNAHARTSTGTSLSASAPASARATSSAPTRPSSAVSLHYVVDTTRRLYKERQYLTADICANVQLRERLAELNGELAELHGMARVVDDMDAQVREFGEEMVGMLGSVVHAMAETTALVGGFARAIRAGQEKHGQGKTPASPDTSPVSADADKENRAPLADGKATSVVNCKATTPLMVRKTPSNRTTRRQPLAPLSPAVSSPLLTCHKKVTAVDNDKPVVARRKSTRVQVVANRNSSTAQEATPKLANVASSTGVSAAASSSKKASEMPVTNKNKHSATEKPKTMHKANKTSVAPKLNSSAKKSMLPRPNITTATTTRERRTAACKPVNYAEPRLGT